MLETLRAWLNGDREYYSGVVMYKNIAGETALYSVLAKGKTDYTVKRLEKEIISIFEKTKSNHEFGKIQSLPEIHFIRTSETVVGRLSDVANGKNREIFDLAKKDADKAYKEVMNMRAQLFALAEPNDFADVNTPDKIAARQKLAIGVVGSYMRVSKLYEKSDHVLKTGALPADGEPSEQADYMKLPAELVKPALDNKRKAVSKIRNKQPTPKRLALIQQHEADLKILEDRWHLLKPNS